MIPASIAFAHHIAASPAVVWQALTQLDAMQRWMADPALRLQIQTDWTVGGPIRITGFHHVPFENRGRVLHCEPERRLSYCQLSSISRLPDNPENYSIFDFRLSAIAEGTNLEFSASQFPTESIYKHIEFYWRVTLVVLKRFVEQQVAAASS